MEKVSLKKCFKVGIPVFLVIAGNSFTEPVWDVQISLDKKVYFLTEPVVCRVRIKNLSQQERRICFWEHEEFLIKDSQGKVYRYAGPQLLRPTEAMIKNVSAGKEILYYFNVLGAYADDFDTIAMEGAFSLGKYWIQAFYKVDPELDSVIFNEIKARYGGVPLGPEIYRWKELKSNIVQFEVIELPGEEQIVRRMYGEAQILDRNPKTYKQALEKYREIYTKYPSSVFAPRAVSQSSGILYILGIRKPPESSDEERLKECERMISSYPSHIFAAGEVYTMMNIYQRMGEFEKMKKILQDLIRKYPSTPVEKSAKTCLDNFDRYYKFKSSYPFIRDKKNEDKK